jgi:hypothetical protein
VKRALRAVTTCDAGVLILAQFVDGATRAMVANLMADLDAANIATSVPWAVCRRAKWWPAFDDRRWVSCPRPLT